MKRCYHIAIYLRHVDILTWEPQRCLVLKTYSMFITTYMRKLYLLIQLRSIRRISCQKSELKINGFKNCNSLTLECLFDQLRNNDNIMPCQNMNTIVNTNISHVLSNMTNWKWKSLKSTFS